MANRSSQLPAALVVTTPSMVPGAPVTHSLESLRQRLGTVARSQVIAYVALAPVATLVESGNRVSTARLVREGTRILGLALDVYDQADETQRALMPALDDALLCAAVSALDTCDTESDAREQVVTKGAAQGTKRRGTRATLVQKVTSARKVVYTAAITLSGADPKRRKQLDDAWGAGDNPDHLARSLKDLTTITREIIVEARARKVSVSIEDALLDAHDALAAQLERATEKVAAPTADAPIAQGTIAWWRGIALWFIRQALDAVETARESDPRIRKIPLGELRSSLRRSGKRPRKTATPPPPAAPAKPA